MQTLLQSVSPWFLQEVRARLCSVAVAVLVVAAVVAAVVVATVSNWSEDGESKMVCDVLFDKASVQKPPALCVGAGCANVSEVVFRKGVRVWFAG